MAKHGTRTMYVHYGCRCELCCKAEHDQYLKRTAHRQRTNSKWGEAIPGKERTTRAERQRVYNKNRYIEYKKTNPYRDRIKWQDIANRFEMRCAICNKEVNPKDYWIKEGRKCFGRDYPTVDHIIPLKNGGNDEISNVQLLCKRCNSSKGARIIGN